MPYTITACTVEAKERFEDKHDRTHASAGALLSRRQEHSMMTRCILCDRLTVPLTSGGYYCAECKEWVKKNFPRKQMLAIFLGAILGVAFALLSGYPMAGLWWANGLVPYSLFLTWRWQEQQKMMLASKQARDTGALPPSSQIGMPNGA